MFGRKCMDCDETRGLHSTPLGSQSTFKHCANIGGGGGKPAAPKCSIEFWAPEPQSTQLRAAPRRSSQIQTTINCCRSNPCANGLLRHRPSAAACCKKDERFSVQPKCMNVSFRSPRLAFSKRTVDGAIAAARELHRCLSDECNSLVLRGSADDRFSSFKSHASAKAAAESRLDWLCAGGNPVIDDDDINDTCECLKWREYDDPAPIRIRSSDCSRRVGARSSSSLRRPSSFKTSAAGHRRRDPCCTDAASTLSFRTVPSKEHLRCPGLGGGGGWAGRSLKSQESTTTSEAEHFWNQLWDNIHPTEDVKNESVKMLKQIAGQLIQDFIRKIKLDLENGRHENTDDVRRSGKKRKQPGKGRDKTEKEKDGSSLSLPITLQITKKETKPEVARSTRRSSRGKEPKRKNSAARKSSVRQVPVVVAANTGKDRDGDTDATGKTSDSASGDEGDTGTSNDEARRSVKEAPVEVVKPDKRKSTDEDRPKKDESKRLSTHSDARKGSAVSSDDGLSSDSSTKSSKSTRSTSTESSIRRLNEMKRKRRKKKKAPVRQQHVLLHQQQQQQQPAAGSGKQSVLYIEKTETIKYHSAPPSARQNDGPAPSKSNSGGHHSGGGGGEEESGGREHASMADPAPAGHVTESASQHKQTGNEAKTTSGSKRKELTSHGSDRANDRQNGGALQDVVIDPDAEETLKTFATDIVQSLHTAIQYKLRNLIRDSRDETLKDEIVKRGEFELKNHILPTFIEHIVWIIKKEFAGQSAEQLKRAMEHDPGQYIDTVVTNAVMKTHSDLKAKSPLLKAFVVMSNCKSAGKRAL